MASHRFRRRFIFGIKGLSARVLRKDYISCQDQGPTWAQHRTALRNPMTGDSFRFIQKWSGSTQVETHQFTTLP